MDSLLKQQAFLGNEVLMLSINGAFQRNTIYVKNLSEKQKEAVRAAIKNNVQTLYTDRYQDGEVSETSHIENIINFKSKTDADFSASLAAGQLNIGTTQKLINLYLKYQWCMGNCPRPPHCPFDRIIIDKLKLENPPSWTKITQVETYQKLVSAAKLIAAPSSLAEWELTVFSR